MNIDLILIGLILFASFTQGLTGFGYALISIPLITLLTDIRYAIILGALCGLVMNIYLLIQLRGHITFADVKSLIIGSVVGIPFGVYFLSEANPQLLKTFLGILVLIFVLLSLTKVIKQRGINSRWGYLFGLFSGLLGGAFNTNGPPILIYFYLQNWDKLKQKASITGFFIVSSVIIVSSHAISGLTTKAIFMDFLMYLPVVLIGLFIGSSLFSRVSSKLYNKIILFGLLAISILLILR